MGGGNRNVQRKLGTKAKGMRVILSLWKVGAGRHITEYVQQHKAASGEKEQWCDELR